MTGEDAMGSHVRALHASIPLRHSITGIDRMKAKEGIQK
jgi:hypothetical protein